MVNKCVKTIIYTLPVFVIWFICMVLYNIFICKKGIVKCDPMNKTVFQLGKLKCCSMWPISHFILYLIWGFLCPECWIFFSIVGVLWELFETILGMNSKKTDDIITRKNGVQYNNYWSGSLLDIIFNSLGLLVGISLNKLIIKKKDEKNLSKEENES